MSFEGEPALSLSQGISPCLRAPNPNRQRPQQPCTPLRHPAIRIHSFVRTVSPTRPSFRWASRSRWRANLSKADRDVGEEDRRFLQRWPAGHPRRYGVPSSGSTNALGRATPLWRRSTSPHARRKTSLNPEKRDLSSALSSAHGRETRRSVSGEAWGSFTRPVVRQVQEVAER